MMICSSLFLMVWDGKAGRMSGESGTGLHLGMQKPRDGWRPSSVGLLLFSQALGGSRFTQQFLLAFSRAGGHLRTPLCGRWSTEMNMTLTLLNWRSRRSMGHVISIFITG